MHLQRRNERQATEQGHIRHQLATTSGTAVENEDRRAKGGGREM